jgi:hypothetical protein
MRKKQAKQKLLRSGVVSGRTLLPLDGADLTDFPTRIFIGVYPAALVFADRMRESAGDYARLASLSYSTLELAFDSGCPDYIRPWIMEQAALVQARHGKPFEISSCGQTVMLGSKRSGITNAE